MGKKCTAAISVLLFLVASVLFCRGYCPAADERSFSSDMISHSAGSTENARVYVSGNKVRTEVAGNIMIVRPDKDVMWMVMPSDQMYMEMPLDEKKVPKFSKETEGEMERVPLGKEKVDGVQTDKFKVVSQEGEMYQWVTDSGFPVKMEAVDGSWGVQYKNIVFGPQSEALFELPQGFVKASIPTLGSGSGQLSLDDILSQIGE